MLLGLQQQGLQALPDLWAVPLPASLGARLEDNDVNALIAYRTQRLSSPGFIAILPKMTMPCLMFSGEADPVYARVRDAVAQMPNVTFFSLPGLVHAETFFRSDLVLPHVLRFLRGLKG